MRFFGHSPISILAEVPIKRALPNSTESTEEIHRGTWHRSALSTDFTEAMERKKGEVLEVKEVGGNVGR